MQPIEIYTDGSCHTQQRKGAWASVIFIDGKKISLKGEEQDTTHHRMELLSVIKSIEYLDEKLHQADLIVYTDSQYVSGITERMGKFIKNNFLTKKGTAIQNVDLVKTLIKLIDSHSIQFVKVKAHQKSDDKATLLNREVDTLSRKMVRKMVNGY